MHQFLRDVLWVRSREADSCETGNLIEHIKQMCECHMCFKVAAIGIDILSQEGDLYNTLFCQSGHFFYNFLW